MASSGMLRCVVYATATRCNILEDAILHPERSFRLKTLAAGSRRNELIFYHYHLDICAHKYCGRAGMSADGVCIGNWIYMARTD
jgi:hypothetical protein